MGIHRRSMLALALLVLMGALLVVVMTGEDAAAQVTEVVITIAEGDRDQTARPTDTVHDILEFRGEMALDKTFWVPGQSVKLTPELLMNNAPSLWEVTFNPTDITYTASGVENFTATVVVPTKLAANSIYQLTFNVTTDDLLFFNLQEGFATVTIAQYYKIGRQYSTLPLVVTQGQNIEFNITIMNRGNGEDTFLLRVTNELQLNDAGLTVVYLPSSGRVPPGGEDEVKMELHADNDALVSEFSLNLTITSEESVTDPDAETVTSGAEWTVVVEAGLTTTFKDNLKYIVPGIILAVVVLVFLVFRRKKVRERKELEQTEKEDKKKKKGKSSRGSKSARPKRPSKEPRPSSDDGPEDKYYGD